MIENLYLLILLNKVLPSVRNRADSVKKSELVAMATSLSSSGGSWSRLSSLLRLCLWLWWKRKKSEVLFFRRYRTRPRAGTEEYAIVGWVDDSSKKYSSKQWDTVNCHNNYWRKSNDQILSLYLLFIIQQWEYFSLPLQQSFSIIFCCTPRRNYNWYHLSMKLL